MKQVTYIIIAIFLVSITACGGDKTEVVTTDVTDETVSLKGYEELDLSEWGFNLTVMVPAAELNGAPEVVLTERGALEVVVGTDFGIEIMYGEGDIELLKMDLKDDLVFTSEIIKEEEGAIIYTQDIPGSGVKTQNHFLYKAVVGVDVYEVRDILDGEYGSGMIEKMLAAAKTLKSNKKQTSV
jgi:hypothetical protein